MNHKKNFLVFFLVIVIALVILVFDYFGIIWHNAPFAARYQIKGLDVSHHQFNIDWQKVAATKKYSFVFIKATEGHDFFDDDFSKNWTEARGNGFLVGAYHFFSMRSSGQEQAEYFISTVPYEPDSLPPVIDIEIATNKDAEAVRKELQALITALQNHYHKKPILYVTNDTYEAYIKGHFFDHKIWIRDVLRPPQLSDETWTFWQYSNRGWVRGIATFVDLNVFDGTIEDLKKLTQEIH